MAIGNGALNRNTVGYQNAAFGYEADVATVNLVNATAIGAKAFVADSNCLVLGSIDGIYGATESVRGHRHYRPTNQATYCRRQ